MWPNLLSLDAPVVAVLWQFLFARCFHASLGLIPALMLLSTVWLIYSADRTMDALRGNGGCPRHEFYRRHWRVLAPVWLAVFSATGWLAVFRLPKAMFGHGVLLLAVVAVYFLFVHSGISTPLRSRLGLKSLPSKEFAVGVVFALGASLVAWASIKTAADAATVLLFAGLCAINCIAIQNWECDGYNSSIGFAATAVGLAAGVLLFVHRPVLGGAEVASAAALLLLNRERRRFSSNALRVLADVAMLSPLFFLPVASLFA